MWVLILEWGEQEASFVPTGGVWGWVTCIGGWLHAQKGGKGGQVTVLHAIATYRAVQAPHFDSPLLAHEALTRHPLYLLARIPPAACAAQGMQRIVVVHEFFDEYFRCCCWRPRCKSGKGHKGGNGHEEGKCSPHPRVASWFGVFAFRVGAGVLGVGHADSWRVFPGPTIHDCADWHKN